MLREKRGVVQNICAQSARTRLTFYLRFLMRHAAFFEHRCCICSRNFRVSTEMTVPRTKIVSDARAMRALARVHVVVALKSAIGNVEYAH